MIAIKRLKDLNDHDLWKLFNRLGEVFSSVMDVVIPIIEDVRDKGEEAVIHYTEKYDGIRLTNLYATEDELTKGYDNIPRKEIDAFMQARDNIFEFHLHQKRENLIYSREDGSKLGVIYQPIEKTAIYVPGGKATYPTSILMAAIPALIAGCKDITLITPPGKDGEISNIILAISRIIGIKRILKAGGAQGIAAAAFGLDSLPKANIIVGPGNLYVTAAKAYLFSMGIIQIDSIAGPSDVLIIADEGANPKWIAFDLLSQAEHDEKAVPILVTTSHDIADRVKEEITMDINSGKGRHEIKKKSISNNGLILLTDDLDEAILFSNNFGPEHMELMVSNPMQYLPKIQNVGSLFLGQYSPVAAGDYYSGTNHILPTGGTSRFSSGLSVETFMRRTTVQFLTKAALKKGLEPIGIMSKVEGFDDKHGGSIEIRFNDDQE
ncbi:MAG: histidinol dehydrogenase [Spirochaetota bacterium]|nr:histidinol dehydrogenase [Spirochaetota bacterium]